MHGNGGESGPDRETAGAGCVWSIASEREIGYKMRLELKVEMR